MVIEERNSQGYRQDLVGDGAYYPNENSIPWYQAHRKRKFNQPNQPRVEKDFSRDQIDQRYTQENLHATGSHQANTNRGPNMTGFMSGLDYLRNTNNYL